MSALPMSREEICRHYRLAADKGADIAVLADLNMTSRKVIRQVLEEGGEELPPQRKTSRAYKTSRGAEIAERLRRGEDVETIARRMKMKEESVERWIRENSKEDLVPQEGAGDPPEAERPGETKRRRREPRRDKKKEDIPDVEPKKETGQAAGGRDIWERVQAVVGAVPESAELETRARAFALCGALFREWLLEELKLRDEKEEP